MSAGREPATSALTAADARLPPSTSTIGTPGGHPANARPRAPSAVYIAGRTGFPVTTALARYFAGRKATVSGNETSTFSLNRRLIRVARPGSKSDSCVQDGIPHSQAATTGGTLTKPPFEKTRIGFSRMRTRIETAI